MKINFTFGKQFSAALIASQLLGGAVSQAAPKLPKSPIFTNGVPAWDCLITGGRGERGIMFLTFSSTPDVYGNYTFDMREIHTKIPAATRRVTVTTTNAPGGRGGTGSTRGDTGGTGQTNFINQTASEVGTNIYGYLHTGGSWGFDYKGNVLGFFVELVIDTVTDTNITYITNKFSFIGKVTPNKRFTAVYSSSIGGNGKLSGVPLKTVTNRVNGSDFSGPWTGNEIAGAVNTVELFSLFPGGFANSYDAQGDGPSYTLDWGPFGGKGPYYGKCLVSTQKKIAFSNNKFVNATNAAANYLRATFGDLKNSTSVLGSNTQGLMQPGSNVVYNAFFVPFVPYP